MILKQIIFYQFEQRVGQTFHINSASDKTVKGVEVWQYSNINEKLNKFSNDLCNDISKIFNIINRGLKLSKDLSVLRNTTMQAALIEVDFISNAQAEKDLDIDSNIKSVAIDIKDNLVKLLEFANNYYLYII